MKKVLLTTDGSCLGNPGPGGWACILRFGSTKKELFGFDPRTTTNRMELMGPLQGMLALKEPCEVEITSDSEYVIHGATRWMANWKRRHWWRKTRPVRNVDLWLEIDELMAIHKTTWLWTKGHANHEDNVQCDWLARRAAETQKSSWPDGSPHGKLRLNLGVDHIPPHPQGSLFGFADVEEGEDEEDPG